MVVICLGPVCIPLWPVIALTVKPLWDRFVPQAWKESLARTWNRISHRICQRRKASEGKSLLHDQDNTYVRVIATRNDYESAIEESHKRPIIIKFTAEFCGPCKLIAPHFEHHALQLRDKMGFYELDIEALDSIALEVGVSSIPAFHVIQGGQKKLELVGSNLEKLEKLVREGQLSKNRSRYFETQSSLLYNYPEKQKFMPLVGRIVDKRPQ